MGSQIEINDTLKIPKGSIVEPLKMDVEYHFKLKDKRIYHLHPVRVFLVIERDGKWDYIGHVTILSQTINAIENTTKGVFVINKLYSREYRSVVNEHEAPKGKGYVL